MKLVVKPDHRGNCLWIDDGWGLVTSYRPAQTHKLFGYDQTRLCALLQTTDQEYNLEMLAVELQELDRRQPHFEQGAVIDVPKALQELLCCEERIALEALISLLTNSPTTTH